MAPLAPDRIGTRLDRMRHECYARVKGSVSLVPPHVALQTEATRMAIGACQLALGHPGAVGDFPAGPVIFRPNGTNVSVTVQTFERQLYLFWMLDMAKMTRFHPGPRDFPRDFLVDSLIPLHVGEVIEVAVRTLKAVLLQRLFVDLVGKGGPGSWRHSTLRAGRRQS